MRVLSLALSLLAIVTFLPACQKREVEDLKDRVAQLENEVSELRLRVESLEQQAGPGQVSPEQRQEMVRKLVDRLTEKTYRADPALPEGKGAVEVMILDREDPETFQRSFFAALQDFDPTNVDQLEGVTVKLGGKTLGKTGDGKVLRSEPLEPGQYELVLSHPDYQERVYPFDVRPGEVKEVATFLPRPGEPADPRERIQEALQGMQQQLEQQQGAGEGDQ